MSQRQRSRAPVRPFLLVCCGGLIAVSAYAAQTAAPWAPLLAVFCSTSCVVLTVVLSPRGWLSGSSVYAAMYAAFHCGLLLPKALGLPLTLFNEGDSEWTQGTAILSAAGVVALGASALLFGHVVASLRPSAIPAPGPVQHQRLPPLGLIGVPVLAVGVLGWYAIVQSRGGTGLIFSGYTEFLAATRGSAAPYAYLCIGLGMAFVAGSSSPLARRAALTLFAGWAVPAALLGLRGEVLLPALAYLVVSHRRRPLAFRLRYAAVALGGLALGSIIRAGRNVGVLGGQAWDWSAFNPLPGLVEMGYSIRPVVEVWRWHEYGLEPHIGSGTYVAPFQRVIAGRLLGLPTPDAELDTRNFSVVVAERVGPIGGSPVAEAFRAYDLIGVAVVMALIGLVLAATDRHRAGTLADVVAGGTVYILLLWVRNTFTPVPFNVLALATLVLGTVAAGLITARGRAGPMPLSRPVARGDGVSRRTHVR